MIFYFHGFASSGNSWKVQYLKKHLEKNTAVTMTAPTLPVNPEEIVALFERHTAENGKPRLVIGSSLGGFYARYAAVCYDIPAVLINPSITPWFTLAACVGINNRYYSGESFEWKKEYLDTLKKMDDKTKTCGSKHHLLHFFLAEDDEILDHKKIPGLFPGAASIRFFDNCEHGFTRFPEIVPEIEKLLGI
ncbi:MAG: hypothetical protein KAW12_13120 [Candidatus Aminicenantes bacterium]|nr:hypothetical protein [Candidatus Aminicenantes bacterium]